MVVPTPTITEMTPTMTTMLIRKFQGLNQRKKLEIIHYQTNNKNMKKIWMKANKTKKK